MSAVAPASSPRNSTGKLAAVCISAISSGDVVNTVISHVPAVSCIHVPTLDTVDAIQRSRNSGNCSGANAPWPTACDCSTAIAGMLRSVESTFAGSLTFGLDAFALRPLWGATKSGATSYDQDMIRSAAMCLTLGAAVLVASAAGQTGDNARTEMQPDPGPIPDTATLLHEMEANQKRMESLRKDYTYHVHMDIQTLDKQGGVKSTESQDQESLTIDG